MGAVERCRGAVFELHTVHAVRARRRQANHTDPITTSGIQFLVQSKPDGPLAGRDKTGWGLAAGLASYFAENRLAGRLAKLRIRSGRRRGASPPPGLGRASHWDSMARSGSVCLVYYCERCQCSSHSPMALGGCLAQRLHRLFHNTGRSTSLTHTPGD